MLCIAYNLNPDVEEIGKVTAFFEKLADCGAIVAFANSGEVMRVGVIVPDSVEQLFIGCTHEKLDREELPLLEHGLEYWDHVFNSKLDMLAEQGMSKLNPETMKQAETLACDEILGNEFSNELGSVYKLTTKMGNKTVVISVDMLNQIVTFIEDVLGMLDNIAEPTEGEKMIRDEAFMLAKKLAESLKQQ